MHTIYAQMYTSDDIYIQSIHAGIYRYENSIMRCVLSWKSIFLGLLTTVSSTAELGVSAGYAW